MMLRLRPIPAWLLLPLALILLSPPAPAFTDDEDEEEGAEIPVLLWIEYINDKERIPVAVPLAAGAADSPQKGKAFDRIAIRPGSALKSRDRPGNRAVGLYRGRGEQRILLGILRVRYYSSAPGIWAPRYQLYQEPIMVYDGRRWQPAAVSTGGAAALMLVDPPVPNAEGYYTSLEFTLSPSAIYLDSWQVQ